MDDNPLDYEQTGKNLSSSCFLPMLGVQQTQVR